MSADLVRVRHNGEEFNTGRVQAARKGFTVLDGEPTHKDDGSPRPRSRVGGRRSKPKVSVADAVTAKKSASGSQPAAVDSQGEVAVVVADVPAAGQLRPDTKE